MSYTPRRHASYKADGAPQHILAVYDAGIGTIDRFTVCLYDPDQYPLINSWYISTLNTCESGISFSQFDEISARHRHQLGKRVNWRDLPKLLKQHIIRRTQP